MPKPFGNPFFAALAWTAVALLPSLMAFLTLRSGKLWHYLPALVVLNFVCSYPAAFMLFRLNKTAERNWWNILMFGSGIYFMNFSIALVIGCAAVIRA